MILCFYLQVHYGLVLQSRGTCAILNMSVILCVYSSVEMKDIPLQSYMCVLLGTFLILRILDFICCDYDYLPELKRGC